MKRIIFVLLTVMCLPILLFAHSPAYTDQFFTDRCKFSSTGRNPYFILEPGYELILEGEEDGEQVRLIVTVLDETKVINGVETRVVRERESVNGELVEISRNYFAICKQNNSVFYFGEDVNIYENGQVVSHEGAWHAGVNDARPGIIMPGTILIGARYFQEIAPEVALDRAEIMKLDATVSTPFGTFTNALFIKETTPLEPGQTSSKYYAPGIGLIKDGSVTLIQVNTPSGQYYGQ
ncbi:MAG TPA: hypothetical protein VLH08_17615 [Acidobacteriota bacterium]|nr:hypothetical protein [Acidobacteriota bacterium]